MITWLLRGLLVSFFIFDGLGKLSVEAIIVQELIAWGFTGWIIYLVGVLQVILGLGLLLKKYASRSAFWLSIMMVAAIIVSLNNNENILSPLLLVIICFYFSIKLKVPKE